MARVLTTHSGSGGTVTRKLKQEGVQKRMAAAARAKMPARSLYRQIDVGAMAAIVKDIQALGKVEHLEGFLDFVPRSMYIEPLAGPLSPLQARF